MKILKNSTVAILFILVSFVVSGQRVERIKIDYPQIVSTADLMYHTPASQVKKDFQLAMELWVHCNGQLRLQLDFS